MIPWLEKTDLFPPPEHALREPNGLLCAGGDLSAPRLIEAYRRGIFPWYAKGEPLLWWSPDPRMVLFPDELKISRSLRKSLRQESYRITLDAAFLETIRACANIRRPSQQGTWITAEMQAAYGALHGLGYAHSVETWIDGQLAGGLYGLAIGKMFYGESMFSLSRGASKIALAHLVRFLAMHAFGLIDCQMSTPHLASFGGREIPRAEFIKHLKRLIGQKPPVGRWPENGAAFDWR